MKRDKQKKLVYIVGALTMIAIFVSTWVAWKNPDRPGYVDASFPIFIALVSFVALFMMRNRAT
jgi:steroid 5-alpha reductase family enzyme